MISREQLHRPSDGSPEAAPIAVDRRRTTNDPGDPVEAGNARAGTRLSSEAVYALGGGAVLLVLALLLHALAESREAQTTAAKLTKGWRLPTSSGDGKRRVQVLTLGNVIVSL